MKEEQDGFGYQHWHTPSGFRSFAEGSVMSEEEQLLTQLYYDHSKWLDGVKRVCESSGAPLEQYLREGIGLSIKEGRVRDCSIETLLELLENGRKGQERLHFFVKKCPHARDALLKGKLPPYPWKCGQQTDSTGMTNKTETDEVPAQVSPIDTDQRRYEIDLTSFKNDSPSLRLLLDLIKDSNRGGVQLNEKRHGRINRQPKTLKELLKKKKGDLELVADKIRNHNYDLNTVVLDISKENLKVITRKSKFFLE